MNNSELASAIIKGVGGKENIQRVTHCVTRLRFTLKNDKKANHTNIEQLAGVMGVQQQGGQFQVIIGSKVNKVYQEVSLMIEQSDDEDVEVKTEKKSVISNILNAVSSILIPSLPPIIGGGMIKGFLFMFWEFGWIEWGSNLFNLVNIVSDGMFYFYPFLLAVSAAKYFKTNQYMALAIAGAMMHPTIYEGIAANLSSFNIFGFINVPYLDYNSSVIPIILSVWLMSYVYRFFEKKIPDIVSVIFTPMLTLIIVIPVCLICICPLGFYFGEYIAEGIQALIDFSPVVAGFVIGFIRPFTVLTGTHHAVRAIVSQQLATYGYTTIGAMNYMSTMAQAAATLAIYIVLRKHDEKMKNLSLSSSISGFLGVTEPGLYGIIVKYKVAMIATMIGGGIGAAISAFFGSAEYAMVMSSLITIPATFGDGFMGIVIGLPVSILSTMLIIFLLRDKIVNEKKEIKECNESTVELQAPKKPIMVSTLKDKTVVLTSPVQGVVLDNTMLTDATFANEMIGKEVTIQPAVGEIVAPCDGCVEALYPTGHAIGLRSKEGVEVLIHIGIDTVNMEGEGFQCEVKQGEEIKKGQILIRFDQRLIKEKGYSDAVMMIITNSNQYLDVFTKSPDTEIERNQELVTILQ